MHDILRFAQTAYIETQNLLPLLREYTNPYEFLSRMCKKGILIRLKNGFFVINEKIEQNPVPYEQIANLLYGPSYISYEWALSYYGLIPEGVYVVTSSCAVKPKRYTTPLGTFEYSFLSHARYSMGIDQKQNAAGNFLIATAEKALADLMHKKSKNLTSKDLLVDLVEARRIDEQALKNLDKTHLAEIAESYRSQTVHNLRNAIGLLT
jgi:predicted transcriptional regulator of viral defense system